MTPVNVFFLPSISTLLLAVAVDLIVGDPPWLPHPVRGIGFLIQKGEPLFRKISSQKFAGSLFAMTIIFLCTSLALYVVFLAYRLSPVFGLVVQIFGIASALAVNSLAQEGWKIRKLLKQDKIEEARKAVSLIVSRNMSSATHQEIIRALIETMTENLSDGVIAPLCFAFLAGLPGIWFYKTVNTLDSMIGYKNETYIDFGWFAAKFDDVLNYIPARITGGLIVLTSLMFGRNTQHAIGAWHRDGQKGPSPNGGIPIVTFAGALDISLGGNCLDQKGNVIIIPCVGGKRKELRISDIEWTLCFHYVSVFLFLLIILFLTSPFLSVILST